MRVQRAWVIASLLGVSSPVHAQVAIGDVFMPEFTTGEVVRIKTGDLAGGDFADLPRFATGLTNPTAICQGPGGRIYVTEYGAGEVTDITDGGDFTEVEPFAFNVGSPIELYCTATRVLAVENLGGTLQDITRGGDFQGAPTFGFGLDQPACLALGSGGQLWAASFSQGVVDVSLGGSFTTTPLFADNDLVGASSIALTNFEGALIAANEYTDQIINVTAGGLMSELPVWATIAAPIGLRAIPDAGLLLAASEAPTPDGVGVVYDLSTCDGTNAEVCAQVFATGVRPFDVAHFGFATTICGNGTIEADEPCDDDNLASDDDCTALCLESVCGDGFVHAIAEECDDANERDDDACLPACIAASCGDGVVRRRGDAIEGCDDGNTDGTDACNGVCQPASCGDGYVQAGAEQCDDQNDDESDGCDNRCLFIDDVSVWGCALGGSSGLSALALVLAAAALARCVRTRRRRAASRLR